MTIAQRRLLKSVQHWGELSPDAEWEVGCTGAAFNAVLDALIRRDLLVARTEGGCTFLVVTDAGLEALAQPRDAS